MREIWKEVITGYEVSNFGKVRKRIGENLYRAVSHNITKQGFVMVSVTENGSYRKKLVHRLVAEAFLEKPTDCLQVKHKDGNRANNRVDNLYWKETDEDVKRFRISNREDCTLTRKARNIRRILQGCKVETINVILQTQRLSIINELKRFYGVEDTEKLANALYNNKQL